MEKLKRLANWPCAISGLLGSATTLILVWLFERWIKPWLWHRRMRKLAQAQGHVCVLDVTPQNIAGMTQGSLDAIYDDLAQAQLPPHIITFLHKLLLARGVNKAFWLREELINYKKVMYHLHQRFMEVGQDMRLLLTAFGRSEGDLSQPDVCRSLWLSQQLALLRGVTEVVLDARVWTKKICCVPRWPTKDTPKMFIAGDYGIHQVPPHFKSSEILENFRGDCQRLFVEMKSLVQTDLAPFQKGKRHQCRACTRRFSKAFVRNEICWICDDEFRTAQRCPFEKGNPSSVCPHTRRCFSCEGASCKECKLVQGDGESVRRLLQSTQPSIVFLDFDRTLCSTRSGCPPVIGKHGMNPGLFDVLVNHSNVHILTRQNHANESRLRNYLAATVAAVAGKALNIPFRVHCLGGTKRTKGEVIASLLLPLISNSENSNSETNNSGSSGGGSNSNSSTSSSSDGSSSNSSGSGDSNSSIGSSKSSSSGDRSSRGSNSGSSGDGSSGRSSRSDGSSGDSSSSGRNSNSSSSNSSNNSGCDGSGSGVSDSNGNSGGGGKGCVGVLVDDTVQELLAARQAGLMGVRFVDADFSVGGADP